MLAKACPLREAAGVAWAKLAGLLLHSSHIACMLLMYDACTYSHVEQEVPQNHATLPC